MSNISNIAASGNVAAIPRGLEWALWAARQGWRVFPVTERNTPFATEAIANAIVADATRPSGFHHASRDEGVIALLWSGDRASARVGLVTGQGRLVLDIDEKNGKSGSATLAANGWTPPPTASQKTPSGGMHRIYALASEIAAPNDAGRLGEGLDRRGDGGYIVLYEAGLLTSPIEQAPEWCLFRPNFTRRGGHAPLGSMDHGPSWQWLQHALDMVDPNDLSRDDWRLVYWAIMQAGWLLDQSPDHFLLKMALDIWCARYTKNHGNNQRQNDALWREALANGTSVGWRYLEKFLRPDDRSMQLAWRMFGGVDRTQSDVITEIARHNFDEILTPDDQKLWFADCILIGPHNRIIDGKGREYGPDAFNSTFGGKKFIIDSTGKITDEAWKAATRSTIGTIPKVDSISFRPCEPFGTIIGDELGRRSVNVYVPAMIERQIGDATPFLDHFAKLIPNESDRNILLSYMAHNAKFPGYKIPWAPVIQSAEGAGKNVIKYVMTHVMGDNYTYPCNPRELAAGGGKFNDWMYRKLFLIADEIKTDEKRDMVEVLKPMISENTLEMQRKGNDQRKADNPANWMFFTNWKDAIPVHANGRRFAIFYSSIQSVDDARELGMGEAYFKYLYDDWLGARSHKTGLRIVADYLLSYRIERGAIPMRAPHTSSMAEALVESRGWLESMIADAIEGQRTGFRGGWISTAAVASLLREQRKDAQQRTIGDACKALGYSRIGQAGRGYFQDDPVNATKRAVLYNLNAKAEIAGYGRGQGYE